MFLRFFYSLLWQEVINHFNVLHHQIVRAPRQNGIKKVLL
jgi:hypothetical protein